MSENIIIEVEYLTQEEKEMLFGLIDKAATRKEKDPYPTEGYYYWYISLDGRVVREHWHKKMRLCQYLWSVGNVFFTKEEAEFALEKQKIKTELQRFADEHNDPEELEWEGGDLHYDIVFEYRDGHKKGLVTQPAFTFKGMDCIYFTSNEIADAAVKTIGKERILKYMFEID